MKRDFLKNLGIEDKDTIDAILNENSADIGRAKGDTDELKSQITQLKTQLSDKTTEFNTLKESTKDYDSLQNTINQLTQDKTDLTNQLNTKISEIQKKHDTENKVRDAKAKNVKAVMALLDVEKDIDEQLEALKTGEDTSFLFGEAQTSPAGTNVSNPPNGGGNPPTSKTFAEAIKNAINKN